MVVQRRSEEELAQDDASGKKRRSEEELAQDDAIGQRRRRHPVGTLLRPSASAPFIEISEFFSELARRVLESFLSLPCSNHKAKRRQEDPKACYCKVAQFYFREAEIRSQCFAILFAPNSGTLRAPSRVHSKLF